MSALGGFVLVAAAVIGMASCATRSSASSEADTNSTESSDSASETSAPPTTDSTGSTSDGTEDSTSETGWMTTFVPDRDFAAYAAGCDPFAQDCPDGEKCVPYASTAEVWNHNKCVPVLGDGEPGEACTYAGFVAATDDCNDHSACWFVEPTTDESEGSCMAFCTGTADAPGCPEDQTCFIGFEGSATMCVPTCDVLAQDCGPGQLCSWAQEAFGCAPADATPVATGEPCADADLSNCGPGDICVPAEVLPACADESCCTSYCDLDAPMPTCAPEFSCEPFFDEAPPQWANVGVCLAPP